MRGGGIFGRCADLFDPALVEKNDTVGHCHCFNLVMCYVNRCHTKATLLGLNFNPHLVAKLCIKIGQQFVKQEKGGVRTAARPITTR